MESKPKDDAEVMVPIVVTGRCVPSAIEMQREEDGKYESIRGHMIRSTGV